MFFFQIYVLLLPFTAVLLIYASILFCFYDCRNLSLLFNWFLNILKHLSMSKSIQFTQVVRYFISYFFTNLWGKKSYHLFFQICTFEIYVLFKVLYKVLWYSNALIILRKYISSHLTMFQSLFTYIYYLFIDKYNLPILP